mmetsp:Transcript_26459/g.85469  ORF Transcript_26459/g.85469 Transcript_26459/m.85469 type:complete len:233 (-) Transcript_26459:935-1633(-)
MSGQDNSSLSCSCQSRIAAPAVKSDCRISHGPAYPRVPNFWRPSASTWKKHRENRSGANTSGWADASTDACEKRDMQASRLERRWAVGCSATLMERCRMPSGTVRASGVGGGADDRKQRKSSWLDVEAFASSSSSRGSQAGSRCRFCKKTHPPSRAVSSMARSASASRPAPIATTTRDPSEAVKPNCRPSSNMSLSGSTPGHSTKKRGVEADDSPNVSCIDWDGCVTYSGPR